MKLLIPVHDLNKHKGKVPCSCEHCSQTFFITKSLVRRVIKGSKTASFCSKECMHEKRKADARETKCCKKCGKRFVAFRTLDQHYCSNQCANSDRGNMSESTKEKIRESLVGRMVKVQTDIVYAKCKICNKTFVYRSGHPKKYCCDVCRSEAFSRNCKSRPKMCKNNNKHSGWYYSDLAGKVWLESTWEVRIAKLLDEHKIDWERPKIGFTWEDAAGKPHKYYPDFYLKSLDVYLDPKNPYIQIRDTFKLNQVRQKHGIKLLVLNEHELNLAKILELAHGVKP